MNGGTTLRRFVIPAVRIRAGLIRGALIRGALPALAGALVLAGCCGSGSTASTSAAAASAGSTASAGLSAFETCLKQHGVTIKPGQFGTRPRASFSPGAVPTGSPRPRASFAGRNSAAFKACAKYAPAGFGGGFNRAISASALAAFKSCLSSNGVNVTGSTASAILSELRNSAGKTAAAFRTCRVLLQPAAPTASPLPGPTAQVTRNHVTAYPAWSAGPGITFTAAGHAGMGVAAGRVPVSRPDRFPEKSECQRDRSLRRRYRAAGP